MAKPLHSIIKILLVSMITMISLISSNSISMVNSNPKIVFDELNYDFDKVEQGIELQHVFKFRNDGSAKLVVSDVKASCGCTGVITDKKKEYLPGETGEIKVVFNTQGRQGVQTKTIVVNSNDPLTSQIILSIKCDIYLDK